jgi:DNA-binding IclR family transcriptional regulator
MSDAYDVLTYLKRQHQMNGSKCHPEADIARHGRLDPSRVAHGLTELSKQGFVQLSSAGTWCLTDAGLMMISDESRPYAGG